MEIIIDKKSNYNDILSKVHKKFSIEEGFYIIIKLYLTNNTFFYVLCILFRFIPLIIISGDYMSINRNLSLKAYNNKTKSFRQFIKILTCHNLIIQFNISSNIYIFINILLYILLLFRLMQYYFISKEFKNIKYTNHLPLPSKYQIIMDHVVFLFFPYILEYLSFSYYIYFFRYKFISNKNIIIIMIINTMLIIIYNINNYFFIICSNKKYITSELEAYSRIKDEKNYIDNNSIRFRCSNIKIYCFILLQNFILFQPLENYITFYMKIYYKIIVSIILLFIILLLLLNILYIYNYNDLINYLNNILLLFCLHTIVFDAILFLLNYNLKNILSEVIYIIYKLILSYITYLLISFKVHKSLEKKIREIIFKEKSINNKEDFVESFIYFNQIMLKIKEKNDSNFNIKLIKFLFQHINKCDKTDCNCKLLILLKNKKNKINDKNENYTSELLFILSYLYESAFLEYDYYNKFDMVILLAEHFCHLKDNPIMAFSLINSLIINHKNKLSKLQKVELYELHQKYIYYIRAKEKCNKDFEITENKDDLLVKVKREEYYKYYFNILKLSYKIKRIMNNYIDNLIKILKNKNLFEKSLSFKIDENYGNIIFVKINYFEQNSNIEENINVFNTNKFSSNLYYIVFLLQNEIIYYNKIINFTKKIDITKNIPIFIIYKYYLFFDILEGGIIPHEISNILYTFISKNKNIYYNRITKEIYDNLKVKYNEQNNNINSTFFAMYEYKKELRIKYFSEECALRLGYKQKEIINKKIDELMPKEFSKSHQNILKKLFIGDQLQYYYLNKSYLFDISNTILYPVIPKGILTYDLSKNLTIISESIFKYENEYNFMLNHKFEIIALSKNFKDEYLLDHKMFKLYDLNIMDILNIKPEKIYQKFNNDIKIINHNKLLRQIKTEEYFIPQLYVPSGESNTGMFKIRNFRDSKNKTLLKTLDNNKNNNNNEEEEANDDDIDENEKLLKIEKFKKEYNLENMIKHNTINIDLNKKKFIENFFKELNKIDYKLLSDNDDICNLIYNLKGLFNKLLRKTELINYNMEVTIKLSYYYDKLFYFISINDDNKLFLNASKNYNQKNKNIISEIINNIDKIPLIKESEKSRNKLNKLKDSKISKKKNDINFNYFKRDIETNDINNEIIKITKFKNDINKNKCILLIKWIVLFITIFRLIIYIITIFYQRSSINTIEKIILAFYYNNHIKGIIFNVFSKLLGLYQEASGLIPSNLSNTYFDYIKEYSIELRQYYHNFNHYFIDYNIDLNRPFNIIYEDRIFFKLKGLWKESEYISKYSTELEYLIHVIYIINKTDDFEFKSDVKNFLFYQKRDNSNSKVYTNYIKLLYYLMTNYDYIFKDLFNEINNEIYKSYNEYTENNSLIFYLLEIIGFFLFLLFFVLILLFLYKSNMIIIKNIILLFLDFSKNHYSNNKNNKNIELIKFKLVKLKNLINDFNIKELDAYFEDLKNINKNKNNNEELMNENIIDETINKTNINSDINKSNKTLNNSKLKIDEINNKNINNIDLNFNVKKIQKLKNNNNSSYDYLGEHDSNLFKNNLNNGSYKNILFGNNNSHNNSSTNSLNDILSKNDKNNNLKNNELDKNGDEEIHEAILNKSNKSTILLIKRYYIIMILFLILIIIYSIYKIWNDYLYNNKSNRFFTDFKILVIRYADLYYYFITLKSIFILSENDYRWNYSMNIMESMIEHLDKSNNEYTNVLMNNKMNGYNKVVKLYEIMKYNKNDSSDYISEIICQNISACHNYLKTDDNIFSLGIDEGFKTCFTYMNNIILDYKKLKNKTNIEEIVSKITGPQFYEFRRIRKSFTNLFYYIQQMIYFSFETDQANFRIKHKKNINILNIISLLISILIFLFVFLVIFMTVENYVKPIKESTYRVNKSFSYIKIYN